MNGTRCLQRTRDIPEGEVWADDPGPSGGYRYRSRFCGGVANAPSLSVAVSNGRRVLLASLALALLAAIVALTSEVAEAQVGPRPAPISAGADWLTTTNYYRATAGLTPVTENPVWSDGDRKHARYAVLNGAMGHYEDPTKPYYTAEGDAAAKSSNLAYGSSYATDHDFVEVWMTAPFHALGILDPRLKRSGFGSYRDLSAPTFTGATALDVLRGRDHSVVTDKPIPWP
ncbi:MAG: CAP domain-containing protein, partial [Actinomycetota bacterium]|nr:CAP domain-containing protein [Actinomycetota bacterium]